MIIVDNLSKSYGKQGLFDSISFKVNRKERVGIVGRNGHGKTTLFRMITGEEEPDAGTITKPRKYRIGYVEQWLKFTEPTVLAEAARALPHDAPNEIWRVEKVLFGLGFGAADLEKGPTELSGGYQVRLNLAKVLFGDFQMLLLDEPSNYLDITSIRWLERFLTAWPGELLLITHDRSFMDNVVTHVLGIHRRKARKVAGDTGKYYEQIAAEEEIYEKTRINDERKMKEMDLFITRFRAKARLGGLVQSRVKSLEKMEKREKLEMVKTLEFAFAEKPSFQKYALEVSEVSFSYTPERPLIRNFSISVGARDRVFVIGRNGRGKTTLLRLIAGDLGMQSGQISSPQSVASGYFEQTHISTLTESNTVLEEIGSADPEGDPKRARFIAGGMMFEGDDALKRIRILSGGEKSRVLLGRLIATPLNLLLLDEPTNHLDIESNDALLEAIEAFDGAVIMVTHNEMFLHALAERLVVFDNDDIVVYEGGYQRFLDKVGWRDEVMQGPIANPPSSSEGEERPKWTPKELRRLRSEVIAERSRVLRPLETRISSIEKSVETHDASLRELNGALVKASEARQGSRVVEISKSMHQAKKTIDALLEELQPLSGEYEVKKAEYDAKLRAFDEENEGSA
ncbi:MAG: ABC-F family ATP-binding cassette domain-containing protein [Candidatus Aminicenantes bacterium]|nr:ABC-F family ATP-binding cassette domain-containing protein [Candidatus Aminicenantes bacterium]